MRKLASAGFPLLLALGLAAAPAQVPVEQLTYRGFSVVRASDLAPALNRYAVGGYRLAAIGAAANGNVIVVMEQLPPESAAREYRVLFGGWAHLRGLHNEVPIAELMNEAGAQGFRFVPASILFENGAAAAVVMEKDPDPSARYAYRIFSPQFETSHRFAQDALQGEAEGFHVVYHGAAGRGPSTLMEKRADISAPLTQPTGSNRFLTILPAQIEKRLQQQVAEGYLPMRSSVWMNISAQHSFWFQKAPNSDLRLVTHAVDLHSRGPAPAEIGEEFARRLNEATSEGYRLASPPVRMEYVKPAFRLHWVCSFNAVMQRSPGAAPVTYRYVGTLPLPDLISRLNDAAVEGFRIVPDSLGRDSSILLERTQPAPGGGAQ